MKPLAERMRPKTTREIIGQEHLLADDAPLYKAIQNNTVPSMILWGPPGVGKTSLARALANELETPFYSLSAISAGVKQIREQIKKAEDAQFFNRSTVILFIDEIHRFSKSQQDALLGAVENGTLTLIGATTENPGFEVINALLSRAQVYTLKSLGNESLKKLVDRAIEKDEYLSEKNIRVEEYDALISYAGQDARKLYNYLEIAASQSTEKDLVITNALIESLETERKIRFDKGGELHYDIISAFIKSVRGSDPQAALYWLARMIEGGEDEKFIARRLIILAAEDIGLANPNALLIANQCAEAIRFVGFPEARIVLSQTTIYLATSPKSNSAYLAIDKAMARVKKSGNLPVPLHLRNAANSVMKDLDYGKGYLYPHNYEGHFVKQEYLPKELANEEFYTAVPQGSEKKIYHRMRNANEEE